MALGRYIGVGIVRPPLEWTPRFRLYQVRLMRTPRFSMLSWLRSTSMENLKTISFRDGPGRDLNPLMGAIGPGLRSLRLMSYSLHASAILAYCTKMEEFEILYSPAVNAL
ncbi:hypothetical protein BD414DRAFT_502878 [Trametes punicea]|nr:hypothetical protein BD414DRAFT_502878 [Trametes punicea]